MAKDPDIRKVLGGLSSVFNAMSDAERREVTRLAFDEGKTLEDAIRKVQNAGVNTRRRQSS